MSTLNVLVVEKTPAFKGGSERMALEISAGIAGRGHNVFLAYGEEGGMLPSYRRFAAALWQLPVRYFGWRTLGATYAMHRALARRIGEARIDVMMFSDLHLVRDLALLSLYCRIPVLLHFGYWIERDKPTLRAALRSLDTIVVPSESFRARLCAGETGYKNVEVISNWVDTRVFRPRPEARVSLRKAAGLPTDGRLLLFVGRIAESKGVDILLRALALLAPGSEPLHLAIAGKALDAEYMARVESMAAKLRQQVHFLGIVANAEDLYPAADITVMPSRSGESFGLVLLEAMSCSSFVLAGNVGALPEVLGEANMDLLYDAEDPHALAQKLELWLPRQAEREARGAALRARVLERFTAEDKIAAYERALERLVAGRRGGRS